MQITEKFTRLDGTPDKAIIRARKMHNGFVCVVKVGNISKTISSPFFDPNDALTFGLRAISNYRENAII